MLLRKLPDLIQGMGASIYRHIHIVSVCTCYTHMYAYLFIYVYACVLKISVTEFCTKNL